MNTASPINNAIVGRLAVGITNPVFIYTSLFLIAAFFTAVANAGQYNKVISIGDPMPSFYDLPTINDDTLSDKDIEEYIVVIVSLANHCPWVKGMDQDLIDLAEQFGGQSVRIIGLSVNHREDDRLPAMKAHAKKYGYNFDYIYDESQALGRKLGATRTPEYFVFNEKRELVYTGLIHNSPTMKKGGETRRTNGEPTEFYVADAINNLLAGEAVAVPETRPHGCSVKYES